MQNKLTQLEAILFSEGGEMYIKSICTVLNLDTESLLMLIQEYNNLDNKATVLVVDDKKVLMRVAAEYAELTDTLRKDEQSQELSKAAIEVLSIVLYSPQSSISASSVEHIRGVNSGYSLRQLTMRGLLSKRRHGMGYQYAPTAELLSLLGITAREDLPEVDAVQARITEYMQQMSV